MVSCGSLRAKPGELRLTQGGVWERKLPIWPARPCSCPLTLSPLARVSHHGLYFSRLAMKSYCSLSGNVLLHTSVKFLCLGVESPSFHGSAGEFTGLHRPPRSQLWLLMVKDTQPSPRKEKTPMESPGQTRDELQQSSSRGATQDGLHSRNI